MEWKEFRPIQVEAIHKIYEQSNDFIVTAQTAGGKTEAAFLPIISKLAENPQPSVQAIYIGPLKALINDQFARLEKLCGNLDIPVHRWHGDVSASSKKQLRQTPSGILLITPESLESNFINYGVHVPRIYKALEYVVIDELHSFLNNVRGIHLLSLLARLNGAAGTKPRIIGLSATLGDPQAACRFIRPDHPETVSLISDPNAQRETKFGIRAYLRRPHSNNEKIVEPRISAVQALQLAERLTAEKLSADSPCNKDCAPELAPTVRQAEVQQEDELDEIATDIVRHFANSTNLIFVNAKKTIENLSVKLHDRVKREKILVDPFVVHHGSISKELREEVEIQLKSGTPTTAICSSTLEMGIDIGSVHSVGQVDTPWSVASMVQRLGRSGRTEGDAQIMRMYVRETSPHFGSGLTDLLYPDLLRAVALTRLMLQKWLEPPNSDRMQASTFIHQILSCLKQTGGTTAAQLKQTLITSGPFRHITPEMFTAVLRGLGEKKLIEQVPEGDLILAPTGEQITSSFDFYAAFKGTEEYLVRNEDEHIGNLPADLIPPVEELIILAGRRWLVKEINSLSKTIFVIPARGGKAPEFLSPGGELNTRVLEEMRVTLIDNDEPVWLDENGKLLLRAARTTALNCGLTGKNILTLPHRVQWFPWIGTRGMDTLKCFACSSHIPHETDKLSISYKVDSPQMFLDHLREITTTATGADELANFLPVKAVQKFDGFLPADFLNIANGHDLLDLEEAKSSANLALDELSHFLTGQSKVNR